MGDENDNLVKVMKMRVPFVSRILSEVSQEMNVKVILEPEFGFVGEIVFSNGKRHLFRNTNLNINRSGSVELAKDKGYTHYFLRKVGISVPDSLTFFSDSLQENLDPMKRRGIEGAVLFAKNAGYPVFVKPNNLCQGELVFKVHSDNDLYEKASRILEKVDVGIVEEYCPGKDYRVVLLHDRCISAYQRIVAKTCHGVILSMAVWNRHH